MNQADEAPDEVATSASRAGGSQSSPARRAHPAAVDRHAAAVARSLTWAAESAEREDYVDALAWLRVIEATGDALPPAFETRRRAWLGAVAEQH